MSRSNISHISESRIWIKTHEKAQNADILLYVVKSTYLVDKVIKCSFIQYFFLVKKSLIMS